MHVRRKDRGGGAARQARNHVRKCARAKSLYQVDEKRRHYTFIDRLCLALRSHFSRRLLYAVCSHCHVFHCSASSLLQPDCAFQSLARFRYEGSGVTTVGTGCVISRKRPDTHHEILAIQALLVQFILELQFIDTHIRCYPIERAFHCYKSPPRAQVIESIQLC